MAGPALRNLMIYRGDTFDILFRLRTRILNAQGQFIDGPFVDLTGAVAKAEIRAPNGDLVVAFTCTIPPQNVPDNVGKVELTLSPAQTTLLPIRTVNDNWDFQVTTSTGRRKTYLKGVVIYDGEVTLG